MSEFNTMYHDAFAKAFFIETPEHERLAIFPYGRGSGDLPLIKAKDAASKTLNFLNGQISGAHPERYFVEPDGEEGNFVIRDTQEYAIVSSWYTQEAALAEIKRMVGKENAKEEGAEQ